MAMHTLAISDGGMMRVAHAHAARWPSLGPGDPGGVVTRGLRDQRLRCGPRHKFAKLGFPHEPSQLTHKENCNQHGRW